MKIKYIVCLLILVACNQSRDIKQFEVNNSTLFEVKLGEREIYNSEIIDSDSISFVPLETTKECLISEINKMIIIDSLVYISQDSKSNPLFIFSINGSFIRKVGNIGRGPGEFIKLTSFCVEESTGRIYILDNKLQKILLFDNFGNLVSEKDIKKFGRFKEIESISVDRILLQRGWEEYLTDDRNSICEIIFNDNDRSFYFPVPEWYKEYAIEDVPLKKNNQELLFSPPGIPNHIYSFNKDSIYLKYEIDFGEANLIKANDINFSDMFQSVYQVADIHETNNYLSLRICGNLGGRIVVNKKTKSFIHITSVLFDLDSPFGCLPEGIFNERFVDYQEAYELKQTLDYIIQNKGVNKNILKKAQMLNRSLKVEDNPIIIIFNYKF